MADIGNDPIDIRKLMDEERHELFRNITLLEQARKYPPPTWEAVFKSADLGIEQAIADIKKKFGDEYYPPDELVFEAFNLTSFDKVKVVIVGQDPYHGHGQAMGLSFSVPRGTPVPPSLANVFKEIKNGDPDYEIPVHGDLRKWAEQGVLMLNVCYTVKPGQPKSHKNVWMSLTSAVVKALIAKNSKIIWILWGADAQKLGSIIGEKGIKLTSVHPSPLSASRGFFHQYHFRTANEILVRKGEEPIDWSLD